MKTSRPRRNAIGGRFRSSTSGRPTCTACGATTSPPACFCFCGSFVNFLIAIGIGSLIIFFLMHMVGIAGVRTGVPFPVLARASFGIWGANFPAIVRAIVACFWYGAQTAAASGAIVALLIRNEGMLQLPPVQPHARPLDLGGHLLRRHLGAAIADHPARHGDGAQIPGLGRTGRLGDDAAARHLSRRQGRRLLASPHHPDGRAAGEDQGRRRARACRAPSPR